MLPVRMQHKLVAALEETTLKDRPLGLALPNAWFQHAPLLASTAERFASFHG